MDRDASHFPDVGRLDIDDDDRMLLDDRQQEPVDDYEPEPAVEFDLAMTRKRARARHETVRTGPSRTAETAYDDEDDDVLEVSEDLYRFARTLAERKFALLKLVALLVLVNAVFVTASWLQVPPAGQYWFGWPLAASLLVVAWLYVRIYVFGGQDFRTIVEQRLERMTQAEMRRCAHRE